MLGRKGHGIVKAYEGGLLWPTRWVKAFVRKAEEMERRVNYVDGAACEKALRQKRTPCVQGSENKCDGAGKTVQLQ